MRIKTSESEAMVLDWKKVACSLRVGGEFLSQVEEFKYLGVLFTSEGRIEREIDRRIGAEATVMQSLYGSVVLKKKLSLKVKGQFTGKSVFLPSPMVMNLTVSRLAWECLGILPEELEEVSGEREIWMSLLRQLPLQHCLGYSEENGCMDIIIIIAIMDSIYIVPLRVLKDLTKWNKHI